MESLFSPADITHDTHGRTGICHGEKPVSGAITEKPPPPRLTQVSLLGLACLTFKQCHAS